MLWTLPYMMRYRHEIPIISLQDAHGEAWWWRGMLTGFRTLFLAREPTWEGWLEALREKRVVAVRHDLRTNGTLRMLGGSNEVRKAFLDRTAEWQWWKNGTEAVLEQMPVAIAVLRPEDRFETGRPEKGINVRIRLRQEWTEGKKLASDSPVTCEAARIDGQSVKLEHVERKDAKGLLEDAYELIRFAEAPDKGTALELVFREQLPSGTGTFTRRVPLMA